MLLPDLNFPFQASSHNLELGINKGNQKRKSKNGIGYRNLLVESSPVRMAFNFPFLIPTPTLQRLEGL